MMRNTFPLVMVVIAAISIPGIGSGDTGSPGGQIYNSTPPAVLDQGNGNWTFSRPVQLHHRNKATNTSVRKSPVLEQLPCDLYVRTHRLEVCTIEEAAADNPYKGIAWICPTGMDCFFKDFQSVADVIAQLRPGLGIVDFNDTEDLLVKDALRRF